MSDLGSAQETILIWWYEHHLEETYSPKEGYKVYQEEEGYEGKQVTFNNLIQRLHDKGLLEKPKYGQYTISDRGKNKADYILNPDKYEGKSQKFIDLKEKFIAYLAEFKEDDVYEAMSEGRKFRVQFSELDMYDPDFVDEFEKQPNEFLEALEQAAKEASIFDYPIDYAIDVDVEHYEKSIYKARSGTNVGEPVTVTGTVETASKVYQEIESVIYECAQCGDQYEKEQVGDKKISPYKCDCGSRKFTEIDVNYSNVLEATIGRQKEENENIKTVYRMSEVDQKMKDSFRPGNKLRVTGVIRVEERSKNSTKGDPYVEVVAFEQQERTKTLEEFDQEKVEEVKQKVRHRMNPLEDFAKSLAPDIVESDGAKKVISASLFGGSPHRDDGRIHSLVLSNPGMGKSDIQEFIEDTFPNSHYSDGRNSTGVGLTATVEQEDGGSWRLKAGKLVYADKGMLSIDEFDKMDEDDASRLNTAMQKPTFPIDKGGVNAELPGEATIIATGNFVEYLSSESIEYIREYIPDHAESLMDRFSLVYAMTEERNNSVIRDEILSSYGAETDRTRNPVFDEEELVIYRELARRYEPVLTQVSMEYLSDWLDAQQSISEHKNEDSFRKDSNRYLVSLAKLTTMFGRTRLSERTNEQDAERAIDLIVQCRKSRGLNDGEPEKGDLNGDKTRRQLEIVRDVIEDLSGEADDGVQVSEIIPNCPMDSDEVESVISQMQNEGELWEPKSGYVQNV